MSRKNLLLISIEDLNDWIEPLAGHPDTVTPNLTRLANSGALFEAAYATTPACSPSRTAALFSRNPWETGVLTNDQKWHDHFPRDTKASVFGHLGRAGFACYGSGKVFHLAKHAPSGDFVENFVPRKESYAPISRSVASGDAGLKFDFGIGPDDVPTFDDIHVAEIMKTMQPGDSGKVWGVGIFRPHLPFIARQEHFDQIPERVSLPPGIPGNQFSARSKRARAGLPPEADEMIGQYAQDGETLEKHSEYNDFLRAYLASINYADALLGKILDHLEQTGLAADTYVVLWSDHGWQLGEKLAFRKFTLWERALRIPFMVAGPGIAPKRIATPVSLLDLAPTALDLLGVAIPPDFDGVSHKAEIEGTGGPARDLALSAWTIRKRKIRHSAVSARTREFRYISYWDGGEELYDHRRDPFETENLCAGAKTAPELAAPIAALRAAVAPVKARLAAFDAKEEDQVTAAPKQRTEAPVERAAKPAGLPDLICIGAQKAGTAWLSAQMAQHPELWNPGVKEIHFFDRCQDGVAPPRGVKNLFARMTKKDKAGVLAIPPGLAKAIAQKGMTLDDYKALFSLKPEGAKGWEITPSYFNMTPRQFAFLRKSLPETRFVFIVREPVARTESALRMKLERTMRDRSNRQSVDEICEEFFAKQATRQGRYGDYIPRWDKAFGPDRLLYLPFRQIITDPAGLMRQVESFVGVSHFDAYKDLETPKHTTKKIEIPEFARAQIAEEMAPHAAFLKERFGEAFVANI